MFKSLYPILKISSLFIILLTVSCTKEEGPFIDLPVSGPDQVFFAISGNALATYNANNVKAPITSVNLLNLSTTQTDKERILSMAFRPHTGELYGLSSSKKIYVINLTTGFCRPVVNKALEIPLEDPNVSIDFDPTADQIKLVTSKGQHLKIDPQTLATEKLADLPLNILGISYDNAFAGTESSILYNLDPVAGKLFKQDGTSLQEVGNLSSNLGTTVSFDISPNNENAIAVSKAEEGTRLFGVNLTTGKATLKGKFPYGIEIQCIAMPSPPVAYAIEGANLDTFNPIASSAIHSKAITGMQAGETVVGMDMLPSSGQIYAIGSTSRLYKVNAATAVFTEVAVLSIPLSGTSFAIDFNSTGNLNVVSNTGQNLNITTAGVATANPNIESTHSISALAYSNNPNATPAIAYAIDDKDDKLYKLTAGTGILEEVGELKVDVEGLNGFDIYSSGNNNTAYGIFTVGTETKLFTIDLTSGTASPLGTITKSLSSFTLGLRF